MKRIILASLFTLLCALPSLAQGGNVEKVPAIALKDLNGKTVKLSRFKGKVVLLNFWATWCVPCAAEIPQLVKWQDEYKDKLQIVGITYPPTNLKTVRTYVSKNKMNYPILLGSKATKKLFEQSDTLPVTIIIDEQGNIVDRIDGVVFSDEFERKVQTLFK